MPPQDSETAQWFEKTVRPHQPALRAWLRARFPSLTDPDDILQDCYLRMLRAHEAGTITNSRTFLFTTVRNAAIDLLRRSRIVAMEPLVDAPPSFAEENSSDVAEAACRQQEMEILHQAIQALPERCRQIMTLQKVHHLSNREIADRLGLSINTVNAQLVIGLVRCRQYLRDRGVARGRKP